MDSSGTTSASAGSMKACKHKEHSECSAYKVGVPAFRVLGEGWRFPDFRGQRCRRERISPFGQNDKIVLCHDSCCKNSCSSFGSSRENDKRSPLRGCSNRIAAACRKFRV